MSRRDELLAKNANIRSTSEITEEEVLAVAQNHRPRSGQGSFSQRQKLEDRVQELESRLENTVSSLIPVTEVVPNPWQPRRVFDEAEIQKLATSINEIGLVQPIVVRSVSIRDTSEVGSLEGGAVSKRDTCYQIVAGERRYRAHLVLGRDFIRAVTLDVTDADMAALALAENMDRTDLSAYEIALAIRSAEASFPSRKNLAEALGLNRTSLYKYLAFFKLPEFVLSDLEEKPELIGRDAADAIAGLLTREAEEAEVSLRSLWPLVKSGDLDQGKIVSTIEAALARRGQVRTDREIKKLFVGKDQAGSITRDSAALTIKIRSAVLTPEKEVELRAVVDRLFCKTGE